MTTGMIVGLILGSMMLGAVVGVFAACLCQMASDADDEMERGR